MNQSVLSFLLVLLIESICAIVSYLKNRLMRHMMRDQ
jgi:CHASE3 domain sensor protein